MADFASIKTKLLSSLDKAVSKTVDFAGKAADSTRDVAGKAAGATRDFAEKAADKAKAGARIAKLNVEISAEKDNMKKTFIEIGKLYYETYKDAPEGFFIQLCEEIALAEQNIAEKQAEIEDLKTADEDDSIEVEFEELMADEECCCGCCCEEEAEVNEEDVEVSIEETEDEVIFAVEVKEEAEEVAEEAAEEVAEEAAE